MRPMKPYKLKISDDISGHFPLLGSIKLDGIRCIIQNSKALSNSLKPIRNLSINWILSWAEFTGLDGELIVGEPNAPDVYRVTHKAVMSKEGQPNFKFHIFDDWSLKAPFADRHIRYMQRTLGSTHLVPVKQILIQNQKELLAFEKKTLAEGFEGIILRRPDGLYKHGRSTKKEGYLMALKKFTDAEAIIIGVEELMHNNNLIELDEMGLTKRSSHKENKIPAGTLGALECRDLETGHKFKVGVFKGVSKAELQHWWNGQSLIGTLIKYKSFRIGVKDLPRHPVFLGFRHTDDC